MPAIVKTPRDEHLWSKAKEIVRKEYNLTPKSERFYPITMGIFERMKGIRKTSQLGSLLKLVRVGGKGAMKLWWPISEFSYKKKQFSPGKIFKNYIPYLSKTSEKHWKGTIPTAIIGTIAAGFIPHFIDKLIGGIDRKRAAKKALQLFPDINKYPQEKVEKQLAMIQSVAPNLSTNPYLLGSLLRQTLQYDAVDPATIASILNLERGIPRSIPSILTGQISKQIDSLSKLPGEYLSSNIRKQVFGMEEVFPTSKEPSAGSNKPKVIYTGF